MSERFDLSDPAQYAAGIEAAKEAISKGELIVLPTDTVYGVGADAFTPWAVARLLAAKGRGRDMPPPVLVGTVRAATALVDDFGPFGQDLIDEFWPGGLTLVARSTPTLAWDLGETRGTVAVRMPLHAAALDLLKKTGPMAVSSANSTGNPAATTADEAVEQLGDSIAVYLDGGPCGGGVASTIIDLTGSVPRLLRAGAIGMDRLREVATLVTGEEVTPPADDVALDDAAPDDTAVDDAASADDAIDAPPDIPSDSPADARADALSSAAGPEDPADPHPPVDAVDATSPPDPVDTTLQDADVTGDAHVSASTPEAWDVPGETDSPPSAPAEIPETPAEHLVEDAAETQQPADAPAAPVTSEAATAEPAAPAAPKATRARKKPATSRQPSTAGTTSTAGKTTTTRKPAAERTSTRRTTTRKPPATSDTPPAVSDTPPAGSDPQPAASDTDPGRPA
jgi:tRNA threonylcarbamoyl adenosine modification protein (Sua5/YciO/YrdC/YwlC family)